MSAEAEEVKEHAIETALKEERRYPPPEELARTANAESAKEES